LNQRLQPEGLGCRHHVALKAVIFAVVFCLPLAGVVAAVWLVWLVAHYTDPVAAVYIVVLPLFFAVGLVAVARRKLELKVLLVVILLLSLPPLVLPVIAGVVWLIRGY
jgi:hypothetical protein